ncbi:MAG TPA: hypothetical protein VJT68_02200 [Thermoleophilaceae bacterium]|nr:hypothetical protein [Thermoleophilaceae bacterium]
MEAATEELRSERAEEEAEQEAEHSKLPHLWAERSWPVRIFLATVPSAAYGALCGWVLGVSKIAYIILAIPVAILLQLLVGLEHRHRGEAAARGFVAGAFFGGFILIVNQLLIDTEPKFHLEDPKWQLAIVTAVFGAGLAWLGAGLRGQLERPGPYLDFSEVSPAELVGMGASLVLLGSLWLPWYSTSDNPNSVIESAGTGPNSHASAWEVFTVFDWLLVSACAAPFILFWIVLRRHELSWSPGEVTMIVGMACFVLILCNGVILGKPEPDIEISLSYGWFLGLLASVGLMVGGYLRQAVYTEGRKPPGTL